MRTRLFYPLLTLSALALTACGSGDPSVSDENSFGVKPPPDFQDRGAPSRCSNTRSLDDNELLVSVETPSPSSSDLKRELSKTTDASFRVESVNGSTYTFNSRTEGDDYILTFPDGIPQDIEVFIRATLPDGEQHRAPIATSCGHVFVNPFSDRLISDIVKELDPDEIDYINECSNTRCPYTIRWAPLADRIQNFEINASALNEREDFATFLRDARRYLTHDPAEFKGDENSQISETFNTVQYGVSLTHDLEDNNTGYWASHTTSRAQSTNSEGTSFIYPFLSISGVDAPDDIPLNFDFSAARIDSPYKRSSWGVSNLDSVFSSYGTGTNRLYRYNNGNLVSFRPLFQTIDTTSDERTIGWAPNPDLYEASFSGTMKEPSALFSSYFMGARGIELTGSSEEDYERSHLLEEQAIAGIEFDLQQTGSYTEPTENYVFAGFELKANPNDGSLTFARATIGNWGFNSGSGSGSETEVEEWTIPSSPIASPYKEFEITRQDQFETVNSDGKFKGNLFLNYDSDSQDPGTTPRVPNGAISPKGTWMTFSTRRDDRNDTDAGDLLRIARQADTTAEIQDNTQYRVTGFSVEDTGSSEALIQHENACIDTSGTGGPKINLQGHRTDYDSGSSQFNVARDFAPGTLQCTLDSSATPGFMINSCDGSTDREIRGVAADSGDTLIMITKSNESVGFLLGFRDDSVEGCPN
ncbi:MULTISPECIES: hypothetical protein [Halomonadaceae]|uniref:Uncharacterized protein n=1 Tax=Vreelandella halophila TaxID=86177 RepID=A0A9X5B3B2_9GAMM|nr:MULTISPECIES: hypothetical protein [Halomonas]MYL25525.1 hypothetical protein [Halomonas utahensis]MYL74761.1 hypothetical protein [Halomonas sp. 22501_18_FS]